MADIVVKYNGNTINPTPLVNQSYQFMDYGNRWGNVLQVELNGLLTGITSTGSISSITNIFSGQFGTLQVLEGTTPIYTWSGMYVDEIAFPENVFFQNSFVPYNVRMRNFNVPSGVTEPVNEYSFSQGEDGIVIVNHKISANGIRNSTPALNNAINFVRTFTGRNPFNPVFLPTGSGLLMSISETINRAESAYSVSEVYKYNTGANQNYVESFTANISDVMESEYLTLDLNWKIQGSPVYNNLSQIESSIGSFSALSKLSNLGISTGNLMKNGGSITRDSGAATIEIKNSYLSGYNAGDVTGYFDYMVSFDKDVVLPKETWKIDGDFVCKGPLNYQADRLNSFKSNFGGNWINYLSGLIVNSPVYTTYHDANVIAANHYILDIQENTGLSKFHISMTSIEGACHTGVANPKYSVEVMPQKWEYNLIPSANVEGHYVVQDPQMMSQAKLIINVTADSKYPNSGTPIASGYSASLESIYVQNGNLTAENLTTGIFDITYNKEWLGLDSFASGLLATKVVGSTMANYIRQPGYRFGY